MSKYSEMSIQDLTRQVCDEMGIKPRHKINFGNERTTMLYDPVAQSWDCCYPVMDALLSITTGINLKSDGTATTEINGKQESAGGGHCRAICELYLMAKHAEVKHDR